VTATIIFEPDPPADQEVATLHKRATSLKDDGRIDEAVQCLKRAQHLMRTEASYSYPIEKWCRLPLFLQLAGHFDEAMQEFKRLIYEVDERLLKESRHLPDDIALLFRHAHLAVIYDKMKVACKREKRRDLAEKYLALSRQEWELHERAIKKVDAWHAKKSEDWERALANGLKAREEFHRKYPQRYR
jgi:tetratricopeptide (TPR) repeat protein